jgi:LacI family transcriptional regulator
MTIRHVADEAGVSIATVSFVLNNRPGQVISEPVKKRVLAAAQKLNYAPSAAAATLARKQTANVAIIFYRNDLLITNPFYSFVVQGAIKQAAASEYNILFSFMHDEYESQSDLPKVIREKNAEGVLFMNAVSPELVRELQAREVAVVAVDCHPRLDDLDTVYVDNEGGARAACRHLLDLGHEEIVMLTAPSKVPSLEDRRRGFLSELREAGLFASESLSIIEAARFDFFSGHQKCLELFQERPTVTGVFCANDEMAAGALRAAHESGRRIPEDLSVVGFDDILMSQCVNPPLSTIGFDKEEMGRRAMKRLLDLVNKRDDEVLHEELDVALVLRASTGPKTSPP